VKEFTEKFEEQQQFHREIISKANKLEKNIKEFVEKLEDEHTNYFKSKR